MDFTAKVVLVTGAARGLGREYARRFAERGASVVVSDLRDCAQTAEHCREAGGRALALSCDVTETEAAGAMAKAALDEFGRIDVLVNNAALFGTLTLGPFDRIDDEEWDATMRVNVKGIWNCCKAAVPAMRDAGGGSIINIASLAALYGMPNGLHYTTSKAAVIGLTRGLAREVGRFNIRVNAVAPNVVDTEAAGEFFGDKKDKLLDATLAQQAIRRSLATGDVAGAILWLASDLSEFTTGQTIAVDGGTVFL